MLPGLLTRSFPGLLIGAGRRRTVSAVAAGVAVVALAAACGGSSAGPTSSSEGNSGRSSNASTITIQSFQYSALTVAPGTKVSVLNDDSVAHTVTADSGSAFDVDVEGGNTGSFTAPSTDGVYKFHCTFHPNMHGTLTVKG